MGRLPTKKQGLELAIEVIDFRMDQLGEAIASGNCLLCKAYLIPQNQAKCNVCPVSSPMSNQYTCNEYVEELQKIRANLLRERNMLMMALKGLKDEG